MCGDPFRGHSVFPNANAVIAVGLQDKESLHKIMDSVRAFSGFAVYNDPLGEHDLGAVDICDEKSIGGSIPSILHQKMHPGRGPRAELT